MAATMIQEGVGTPSGLPYPCSVRVEPGRPAPSGADWNAS